MNEAPTVSGASEEVGPALAQLRRLVAGLALIVFVVSLCFSGFVWKITRNTQAVTAARRQQLTQLQSKVNRLSAVANDLGNYSAGRPELLAIFRQHGIDLKAGAAKSPPR